MKNTHWTAIAAIAISAGLCGCYPAPFSQKFSGRVVDENGKPIKDAFVVTSVYKRCGSLGGESDYLANTETVQTDSDGHYKNRLSGITISYTLILAGCGGYKPDVLVCKAGFEPAGGLPAENAEARLMPGSPMSMYRLPAECSSSRVTQAQDKVASLPAEPSQPHHGVADIMMWDKRQRIHLDFNDPRLEGNRVSDSPEVYAYPPSGALYWLEVENRSVGGRTFPTFSVLPATPATPHYSAMGWLGYEEITHLLIALGPIQSGSTPVKSAPHDRRATKVQPLGGAQWSIFVAGNRRVRGPISPNPVTLDDWAALREEIPAEFLRKNQLSLFDPKGLPARTKKPPPERYSAKVSSNQRLTMPLWDPHGWIVPVVQDPGGPSAPYPNMPVVRVGYLGMGTGMWLVINERHDPAGKEKIDLRGIRQNDLFYTRDYGASDGKQTTYVFGFEQAKGCPHPIIKPPVEDAHMKAAGIPDVHIWLEPVGGIRWSITTSAGVRIPGPLVLETLTKGDWKRFRSAIVAFDQSPEEWQYVLCDPTAQQAPK